LSPLWMISKPMLNILTHSITLNILLMACMMILKQSFWFSVH
jgi:hypothetical protein